uniref:Uncharacterized protein n=1 Tax=Aegilops tauschii subsp. strangulata TaxID=200361 RepID=A0A453AL37_AEGTS
MIKNLTLYRHKSKLHSCIQQQASGINRPEHKNPRNHAPRGGGGGHIYIIPQTTTTRRQETGKQPPHLQLHQRRGEAHKSRTSTSSRESTIKSCISNYKTGAREDTNHVSPTPAGSQQSHASTTTSRCSTAHTQIRHLHLQQGVNNIMHLQLQQRARRQGHDDRNDMNSPGSGTKTQAKSTWAESGRERERGTKERNRNQN